MQSANVTLGQANAQTKALTQCVANLATNVSMSMMAAALSFVDTKVNSSKDGCNDIRMLMCVKSLADDDDEPTTRVEIKIAVATMENMPPSFVDVG